MCDEKTLKKINIISKFLENYLQISFYPFFFNVLSQRKDYNYNFFQENKVSHSLVKTEIDELKRNNGLFKIKKKSKKRNTFLFYLVFTHFLSLLPEIFQMMFSWGAAVQKLVPFHPVSIGRDN